MSPEIKAKLATFTEQERANFDIILSALKAATAAEREACAQICDGFADANENDAVRRGKALGKERADQDKRCAALWATYHAAREIAAHIRARQ